MLVYGVDVRLKQLRLNHIALTLQARSQRPVLFVTDVTCITLTDKYLRTYIEGLFVQQFGYIPVHLQPGHIVTVVTRLRFFGHVVGVLGIVRGYSLTLSVAAVRYLQHAATGIAFHPRTAVSDIIIRTRTVVVMLTAVAEDSVPLAVQYVIHTRLALAVHRHVVVVRTARIDRQLEVHLILTRDHR